MTRTLIELTTRRQPGDNACIPNRHFRHFKRPNSNTNFEWNRVPDIIIACVSGCAMRQRILLKFNSAKYRWQKGAKHRTKQPPRPNGAIWCEESMNVCFSPTLFVVWGFTPLDVYYYYWIDVCLKQTIVWYCNVRRSFLEATLFARFRTYVCVCVDRGIK